MRIEWSEGAYADYVRRFLSDLKSGSSRPAAKQQKYVLSMQSVNFFLLPSNI